MSRWSLALILGGLCWSIQALAQPEFTVGKVTAIDGETVDVTVVVDEYTEYISLQYSMNWDPSILSFVEIVDVTDELPGFIVTSSIASSIVVDTTAGNLIVSWFEQSIIPTSLPNGTNLYTLRFVVMGDECDSSAVVISDDPIGIEIANADANNVGAIVDNGFVKIDGTDCITGDGGVTLSGSMETSENGNNVCVQYTASGFTDIATAQFTITFDQSILDFTGVSNINWPGVTAGGNFGDIGSGRVTFVWSDPNATGVDIADGTVVFELCFDVIGSSGQISQVAFGNDPREIEFSDGEGNIVDFTGNGGSVAVVGEIEGFALILESGIIGAQGGNACVQVFVNDFTDIVSLQFSLNWDANVLTYTGTQDFNLPDFTEMNVAGPEAPGNAPGEAVVTWIDQYVQGVSVPNGTSIFSICFDLIGECDDVGTVTVTDTPIKIEVGDANGNELPNVATLSGDITLSCGGCGADVSQVVSPSCPGASDGSIEINVLGCVQPLQFLWSNGETTEDISDLPAGEYIVTITASDNQIVILDTIFLEDPDAISATADITDAQDGSDGAIDLTVSGGTSPYNYAWSNGETTEDISGLDVGAYNVTITDGNNCEFAAGPYNVRDAGAIAGTVSNVACFGENTGAITLTQVECGPEPYNYVWSNGTTTMNLSSVQAGSYGVTVTANDGSTCERVFDVIGPDEALVVTGDTTNESGSGGNGAIDLNVSGGVPPYAYAWSNGATTMDISGLTTGRYTVTVTDDFDCEVVEEFLISGREIIVSLETSDFSGFDVSCFGERDGFILATVVNGVGAVQYTWSNGETGQVTADLAAGAYSVTVTDEIGRTAEASVVLSEPQPLVIEVDVTCASEPGASDGSAIAVVTGGIPGYSFQWSTGETSSSISGQSTGPVVVFVSDENSCQSMEQSEICINGIDCYEASSVITPNGDGKNDNFLIQCVFDQPNRLMIYNRFGGLEYEVDNYDNSWMGTDDSGNELSDGGYHWVLEVFLSSGDNRVFSGTVALVRSLD